MLTNPNLGEFVERNCRLYFIKSKNLPAVPDKASPSVAGHPSMRSPVGFAYLLGYAIALVVLVPIFCLVILFPLPLFAISVATGVLGFIHSTTR